MKIWVPKQSEVAVEVILQDNPDSELKAGDLAVTMDGRTRIWSPDEFAERFEEKRIHEWPGFLNMMSPDGRADSGCVAVSLVGKVPAELAKNLNDWSEAAENRSYIVKHLQTGVAVDDFGKTYHWAFFTATTETTKEDREHLADVHNEVTKLLEEKRAKKAADDLNHLEKARELQAAARVVEKTRQRELERLAEAGKRHEANCGKAGKGKK